MSDLLAIVDLTNTDEALLAEIIRRHPDRVTVLAEAEGTDWASDDSPRARALRDRLATLAAVIESRTGAVVVGLVASREQLLGWRFDRIVGASGPTTAL